MCDVSSSANNEWFDDIWSIGFLEKSTNWGKGHPSRMHNSEVFIKIFFPRKHTYTCNFLRPSEGLSNQSPTPPSSSLLSTQRQRNLQTVAQSKDYNSLDYTSDIRHMQMTWKVPSNHLNLIKKVTKKKKGQTSHQRNMVCTVSFAKDISVVALKNSLICQMVKLTEA